jgi:MFS family permease
MAFDDHATLRALRHRPFRRWMVAGLVSVTGSWMQQVAQSWLVYERTRSGTQVGLTIALQAAPALLLGLWGGVLADRFDRRRLLLVTQSANAVLAAALAVAVGTGAASVWMIQLFGLLAGVVAVVDGPASGAYSAGLLPADDLANGVALGSVVSSAGRVVGLAAAGVVVAIVGPASAFALNAATFGAPLAVLVAAAPAPPPGTTARRSARSEAVAGLRHVWSVAEARATISTAWVLSCFGRNYQVTMALMAAETFRSGAAMYGRFSTLFALGAVAGSIVAARCSAMTRRVLVVAGGTGAVLQVASGVAGGPWWFGVLMVPIAACAVVLDTATSTRVQLSTDPALRGRVLAISGLGGMTAGMVGGPLLGLLGSRLGARAPLMIGGAVATLAVLAFVQRRVGRPDPVSSAALAA